MLRIDRTGILSLLVALAVAGFGAGCSSSSSDPGVDSGASDVGGGSDAGLDTGLTDVGGTDAGIDADAADTALPDAIEDAGGSDVGSDTSDDVSVDASDAGDASDAFDAAMDAGSDVGADVDVDAADTDSDASDGPLPGFGAIEGACGVLTDAVLDDPTPVQFRNAIDFGDDPFDEEDADQLTDGGFEVYTDPNAGGSSIVSETFAFEVLARCEGATLVATELEVAYDPEDSAKTDLVVAFDDRVIGVSVTRAVTFPREAELGVDEAARRMTGKLEGILESTANAVGDVTWDRQILHVIAWGPEHADDVSEAWDGIDAAVRADTILMLTTSNGQDAPLYE